MPAVFMDRVADLFVRHRALVALVVVLYTVAAAVGNARLGFDDVPRSVFRTEDDDFVELEKVFEDFGSDDNDCVIVIEPAAGADGTATGDLFTPERIAALRATVDRLKELEGVSEVRSLSDVVVVDPAATGARSLLPSAGETSPAAFAKARQAALEHPLIVGQVLSPDARTALAIARLAGNSLSIREIEPLIVRIREVLDAANEQGVLRVRLTGIPPIRTEIFSTVQRESKRFIVIGAVLGFGMATVLFRRFWAVVIVASAPILGAFWTMGTLGLMGEKLNVINTILPTLVIVIGFTDSVHLMHDIRRSNVSGLSPLDAAKQAICHLGLPCFLTSFTTCIGFGSLAVAGVEVIRRFGITCALGTVLSFLSVITLVPLLSSTALGRRVHMRRLPEPHDWHSRFFDRLVDLIERYPRFVSLAGTGVTLVLGWIALGLVPDNRLTETIPPDNESFQALAHCDEAFGGMLMAYALVEWPETQSLKSPEVIEVITEVQRLCDEEQGTSHPLSVINLLRALPGQGEALSQRVPFLALAPADVVQRLVRTDLRQALVTVHLRDVGTAAHRPVFDRLQQRFAELEAHYPGTRVRLTGSVVVAGRNINQMITDLANSLGLAAVVIFVSMTIAFRSLRFGLISIVPNVFPLVVTAAVLVLLGRPLQVTSVIVFSICLGIAVDDTIHVLARFRREMEVDGDVPAAVRRTFHAVGEALVMTTVVLVTGFSSVLISEMPSSRLFAWMSCTAIAAALIGDLIILPAMICWFVPSQKKVRATSAHDSPHLAAASFTTDPAPH